MNRSVQYKSRLQAVGSILQSNQFLILSGLHHSPDYITWRREVHCEFGHRGKEKRLPHNSDDFRR